MINKERETLSESGGPFLVETLFIMEEHKKALLGAFETLKYLYILVVVCSSQAQFVIGIIRDTILET